MPIADQHIWRLSAGGDDNLGLSFTADGLVIGRTPLFERHDGCFVPRRQTHLERLLSCGFGIEVKLDHVMPGLATVAAALNRRELCRASIAAVHLRIPDLPDPFARLEMETEDLLIKVEARVNPLVRGDWNPDEHPRTGASPNPGWFAPKDDANGSDAPMQLSNETTHLLSQEATRLRLPPGNRVEELGDLLEWIANAKPEDTPAIRQEIKRLYYDVGDHMGGDAMNAALSDVLEDPDPQVRQSVLDSYEPFTRSDPAEVGQFNRDLIGGILLFPPVGSLAPAAQVGKNVWELGWAERGRQIEQALGADLGAYKTIDRFADGMATSIKSIDLRAATYQDTQRLFGRISRHADDLAAFEGGAYGGFRIESSDVTGRTLNVAIPKGGVTPAQQSAIDAASDYAKSRGVILRITPF